MAYEKLKSESYKNMGGMNNKVSPYDNSMMEFRDLTNVNFRIPGALTKRPGTSLYIGSSVIGSINGLYEFTRLNGSSYLIAGANTNLYNFTNPPQAFATGLLNNGIFSFVTFVDRLFSANGHDFFKYDGSTTSAYSLPPGITGSWFATVGVGGGLSGTIIAAYGYRNDRGYNGPVSNGFTVVLNGITFGSIIYNGMTTPTGFGITSIALYRTLPDQIDYFGTTYAPAGTTTITDTGFTLTSTLGNFNLYFTMAPKYLEIYNNQLFMAGFSAMQSTAFWSEIGEPEGISAEFFNEFRTNDGDRITGLKAYYGSLIVAKQRSLHRLVGSNPTDFQAVEITDQYGCLSHRTMITFQEKFVCLDSKGILYYNGSNLDILSIKIQPVFERMNIPAALDQACALHVREFNEVWFAIPVDGSTVNNLIIVYDYILMAWTKYEGVKASSLATIIGTLPRRSVLYGGYTGAVFNFGASYLADNGQAFTCLIDSKFMSNLGESIEQQYRRLFLNCEPITGATSPITVNMRTNYGSTIQLTRTMYQNPFQSRIDFGLSAKTIQFEMAQTSASLPMTIYGWTFESRYQRAT